MTRTIESARHVLRGFLGDIAGSTITIYTTEEENETMHPNLKACKKLRQLFKQFGLEARQRGDIKAFTHSLALSLNVAPESIDLIEIRDVLVSRLHHKKVRPLPLSHLAYDES